MDFTITWKQAVIDAVACKVLPVKPGDLIKLAYTRNTMLILAAHDQTSASSAEGSPSSGQWIQCLINDHGLSSMAKVWLDWSGFGDYWSIM